MAFESPKIDCIFPLHTYASVCIYNMYITAAAITRNLPRRHIRLLYCVCCVACTLHVILWWKGVFEASPSASSFALASSTHVPSSLLLIVIADEQAALAKAQWWDGGQVGRRIDPLEQITGGRAVQRVEGHIEGGPGAGGCVETLLHLLLTLQTVQFLAQSLVAGPQPIRLP